MKQPLMTQESQVYSHSRFSLDSKQLMSLIFQPTAELLYKSKYRIKVQDGPSVDFILRGTGKDLIKRKV
ncbi:unnamed protein product (macronuclear) [Paramecium tetraurelia]|uniref:Uncharacterized protein n=1 Tax=Paramecium tetraurelia TaxID=5888 RepID=A0CT13_PARTE|nr:uncharacterized protein GSPATT00038948001 [Paramecium tetraurelia]CAK73930.1 unnamed protein product [Paramecium tetraurelia]|eukprot:XP_001441327.1 hypothetical protein (macronuclear) [Paramecium tetraurelia strain d4-2]